jgi:hypothetical protein
MILLDMNFLEAFAALMKSVENAQYVLRQLGNAILLVIPRNMMIHVKIVSVELK